MLSDPHAYITLLKRGFQVWKNEAVKDPWDWLWGRHARYVHGSSRLEPAILLSKVSTGFKEPR